MKLHFKGQFYKIMFFLTFLLSLLSLRIRKVTKNIYIYYINRLNSKKILKFPGFSYGFKGGKTMLAMKTAEKRKDTLEQRFSTGVPRNP